MRALAGHCGAAAVGEADVGRARRDAFAVDSWTEADLSDGVGRP